MELKTASYLGLEILASWSPFGVILLATFYWGEPVSLKRFSYLIKGADPGPSILFPVYIVPPS